MSESDWDAIPILVLLIYPAACCALGVWVAAQKGRSRREGFWLGFIFGVFGVIVEALLPTKP